MKTTLIALLVSLAASAGACWFYLDGIEADLRAFIDEMATVQTEGADFDDFTRQYEDLFDEDWDHALDERLDEARAWTWRHVYPRLVVFTFLCALVTALATKRRPGLEPS